MVGQRGALLGAAQPWERPWTSQVLTSSFPNAPGLFPSASQEVTLLPGVAAVPKQGHWIPSETLETLIY